MLLDKLQYLQMNETTECDNFETAWAWKVY